MRYLVVLEAATPQTPPPAALMEGIMQLGAEAVRAGVMLDNAGLAPSDAGALVTAGVDGISVTDGPFAESKEMISYVVYDTRTKDEAVEWTRRFMALHTEHWPGWTGEARVLQIMGPEDVGPPPDDDR
jgi:hypothetical protein